MIHPSNIIIFLSSVMQFIVGISKRQLEETTMIGTFLLFKKQKTCTMFLSSYRNTSGSLGEREMLWEHEPQASVSTAFSSSPNFHEPMFQKTPQQEGKQLVNFDYQNVNSLCSRHHYVNRARQFCVSIELYKHDF